MINTILRIVFLILKLIEGDYMAKYDMKRLDPERYVQVQMKQEKLRKHFMTEVSLSVECPFCHRKVGRIFKGNHGAIECKCDNCGEIFIFPPVSFSRAKTRQEKLNNKTNKI